MRYIAIAFLVMGSLSGVLSAQDSGVTATAYQTVNVRSGPSTQYEIIGQLSNGDTVPVVGRDSETARWLYIAMPGSPGTRGWVATFTVTTSGGLDGLEIEGGSGGSGSNDTDTQPEDGVSIMAFGRVNVRSGPGINYEVVGQLEIDDEAQATARSNYNNDWLYVENNSIAGWVAYFTVTVRGNANELPVLVPDTVDGELVPPSTLIMTNFNVRLHSRPAFSAPATELSRSRLRCRRWALRPMAAGSTWPMRASKAGAGPVCSRLRANSLRRFPAAASRRPPHRPHRPHQLLPRPPPEISLAATFTAFGVPPS